MGGLYVFPGGKVDDADCAPAMDAWLTGLTDAQAADILGNAADPRRALGHFVAAVRETFEEAGVLLAEGETHAADMGDDLRRRLHDGEIQFSEALERLGTRLDLTRLRYLDHWITPPIEPRRFTARFFLAAVPAGQDAAHDEHETTDGVWLTAKAALARYDDPTDPVNMAPPTLRILWRLAGYDSIRAALDDAPHSPMTPRAPRLAMHEKVACLVMDGDPLHPDNPGETIARFELHEGKWRPVFDG